MGWWKDAYMCVGVYLWMGEWMDVCMYFVLIWPNFSPTIK